MFVILYLQTKPLSKPALTYMKQSKFFMNTLPPARCADVAVQELGKELLIYDFAAHKAYSLNETSSNVFQACDGKTTFDELKRRHQYPDDLIFLALDELKKQNLLAEPENYHSPLAGMSRREIIRNVGLATMFAMPVISSLVAPTAANAASGTATCTPNAPGCSPISSAGTTAPASDAASCAAACNNRCCSCQTFNSNFSNGTCFCTGCTGLEG